MNEDILQQRADFDASEESSDIKLVSEKAYIIPGVSTSMINGVNVNACFNGNSKDIITCITSYSGLEPSDFVALLAPTYDKNAPQEAMGYYKAYRDYINELLNKIAGADKEEKKTKEENTEKAKKAEITNHCRQQCAACGSNSLNGGKCDALCQSMV